MELPVGTLQQLEAATEIVCNQTWAEVRPVSIFSMDGQEARLMWGSLGLGELEL